MSEAANYWDNIGKKVLEELERRLNEGQSAADLPGTLLMRLAEKYIQFLEKKALEEASQEIEYMSPLAAIDQEGLPIEHKVEILKEYIGQMEQDHAAALNRLTELERELHGLPPLHEPEPSA